MTKPNMSVQDRKKFSEYIITIAESKPEISPDAMDALMGLCNMFSGLARDSNFSVDLGEYINELCDLAHKRKEDDGWRLLLRKNIISDINHADEYGEDE